MDIHLALFSGGGLLDVAARHEGLGHGCGPDRLWGADIRDFHAPRGVFRGIWGGPPCQPFSRLVNIVIAKGQTPKPNLIPEFERVVGEAQPEWFLMENVPAAPEPRICGYQVHSFVYDNHWAPEAPEQGRERRFSFGTRDGRELHVERCALENPVRERAVVATSSKEGALAKSQQELRDGTSRRMQRAASVLPGQMPRRTIERCCELQGLPVDYFTDAPFTSKGKYELIGNGVPVWTGRALFRAVKRAMGYER